MPLLLVGAGGHARSCIDVIESEGRFRISGLVGLAHEVGTKVLGYPVLGTDKDLAALLDVQRHALVVVGQIKSPEVRIGLFSALENAGVGIPCIVSPRAHVSRHARVGVGSIVMHGAVINAGAVVGRNCIINSQALIEHDAVVGDHCHVSTSAVVNGGVRIGEGTFLGSGCRIREAVAIGDRSVIGMGQMVLVDCPSGTWLPKPGNRR